MQAHGWALLMTADADGSAGRHPPGAGLAGRRQPARLADRPHGARQSRTGSCSPRGADSLALFWGPHAYVSPTWYTPGVKVPTWNYVTVHAYGRPQVVEDTRARSTCWPSSPPSTRAPAPTPGASTACRPAMPRRRPGASSPSACRSRGSRPSSSSARTATWRIASASSPGSRPATARTRRRRPRWMKRVLAVNPSGRLSRCVAQTTSVRREDRPIQKHHRFAVDLPFVRGEAVPHCTVPGDARSLGQWPDDFVEQRFDGAVIGTTRLGIFELADARFDDESGACSARCAARPWLDRWQQVAHQFGRGSCCSRTRIRPNGRSSAQYHEPILSIMVRTVASPLTGEFKPPGHLLNFPAILRGLCRDSPSVARLACFLLADDRANDGPTSRLGPTTGTRQRRRSSALFLTELGGGVVRFFWRRRSRRS